MASPRKPYSRFDMAMKVNLWIPGRPKVPKLRAFSSGRPKASPPPLTGKEDGVDLVDRGDSTALISSSSRNINSLNQQRAFNMMDLPVELREMIYQHALVAGTVSILRTGKQVKEEAERFIYSAASLRFDQQAWDGETPRPAYFQHVEAIKIKNVTIDIDVKLFPTLPLGIHYTHFSRFAWKARRWNPPIYPDECHKQTCTITLRNLPASSASILEVLDHLRFFPGYENLFLLVDGPGLPVAADNGEKRATVCTVTAHAVYEMAVYMFGTNYGPAKWHWKNGGGKEYLEYHLYLSGLLVMKDEVAC